MRSRGHDSEVLGGVRRIVLCTLVLGLSGTATDLLFIRHFEDTLQLIPLALVGGAALCLTCHGLRPGPVTVRALQAMMLLLVLGGLLGVVFHYQANVEFQRELDPSLGSMALFWKVMRATAPPALAPGTMAQLGLLGMAFTYRHPALDRRFDHRKKREEEET